MKLNGYKCDRCGAYYEKNAHQGDKTYIGVALVDLKMRLKRYELCDECLGKFSIFMNGPTSFDPSTLARRMDNEN